MCAHFSFQLLCGEDLSEAVARCSVMVGVDEECDEVLLACLFSFLCFCHSLLVGCVSLVVSEDVDNVGHADLEYHVHTALQVEAQTDLCFQTLLVGVVSEILHGVFVVLLSDRVAELCCLAVIVACGNGERQVEDACKRQ